MVKGPSRLRGRKTGCGNNDRIPGSSRQRLITLMGEIHKLGLCRATRLPEKLVSAAGTIEANLNNYVEKGKAEFVSALAARKSADDNALQGEVDPQRMLDAMMELRLKADKSLLEQTIATAA
ncbi:MAG: hypothetical protein ACLVJ6_13380 [Merdibacter sp.]